MGSLPEHANRNPRPTSLHPEHRSDGYLPTLDGWRAIAVSGVIVYHLTAATGFRRTQLGEALDYGKYGVELFFAISGYLITTRLYQEHQAKGRVSLRDFYLRRAFRILPPALLFLVLTSARALYGDFVPSRTEWFGSLFFFRNYVGDGHRLTEHLWSLSVEEHFYLFWPALFLFRAVRSKPWVVPLMAAGIAVWRLLVLNDNIPQALMSGGSVVMRTDLRLDALFWGAALAIGQRNAKIDAWLRHNLTPLACGLAMVAFLAGGSMSAGAAMTVQACTAPLIVVGTVLHPEWRFSRWLEWPPLRWIGRLSYGLYLFQQILLPYTAGFPYAGFLILPLACASYYAIEQPILRLGRGVVLRRLSRDLILPAAIAGVLLLTTIAMWWRVARVLPGTDVPACTVVVYDEAEFMGRSASLGSGVYDLTRTPGIANDSIMSLKTGERTQVRACDALIDGKGAERCHVFHPNSGANGVGALSRAISYMDVTCN